MIAVPLLRPLRHPALARLCALAPLDADSVAALEGCIGLSRPLRARREIVRASMPSPPAQLIVSGWAAGVRLLVDGRRQFLNFLMPGDLIGDPARPDAVSACTVVALTDLVMCNPPAIGRFACLDEAYAVGRAIDEALRYDHITRLGRMNAQERIADLLLELCERSSIGKAELDGSFELPLTQEDLADALGLTAVHVNRMIQALRRDEGLSWKGRRASFPDPAWTARKLGRVNVWTRKA